MAIRADPKTLARELESLIVRVSSLEAASGMVSSGDDGGVSDILARVDDLELKWNETAMSPKKLAVKLGQRLDQLDERIQAIETKAN